MITKQQFVNSLTKYIDTEVLPNLPTLGQWGLGTIVVLAKRKADTMIDDLMTNKAVCALELVTEDGMIDDELLIESLKESASKYGKMDITFPVIGTMTFSSNDVEKLKSYMNGGNTL